MYPKITSLEWVNKHYYLLFPSPFSSYIRTKFGKDYLRVVVFEEEMKTHDYENSHSYTSLVIQGIRK